MCLEEVGGVDAGGEIAEDELGVLAARLGTISKERCCGESEAAYNHYAFAPSSCPLSADEADPVAHAIHALSDCDFGVELDAHAEVEVEGWGGDC